MKVNVTIPDGPFAEAVIAEAAKQVRSEARLITYFTATMLRKYKYEIPRESKRNTINGKSHA